jgi:tetratricopeptide (TPR) repeat protein
MPTNRFEALQAMLAQDPNNAFARYGLAMEYANNGDLARAAAEYEALLLANPAYVAAYFHAGQTLEKLGKLEEARQMYTRGVEASTKAGDLHTRSEIQAALDLLG